MKRIIATILVLTLIFTANVFCISSNALPAKTINVKSCGANGADKKDDTDAFQKAFDIAKSGRVKLKVIVPKGNYYIGTPAGKSKRALWIYSNTTLSLASGAVLYRQKKSPDTYIIEADGKKNVQISGGTFNGNVANTKYARGLISLRTMRNVKLKNANFKNYCGTHAVLFDGPVGLSVIGCTFSGFKRFTGSAAQYKKQTSSSTYWSAEALHIDFVEPTSKKAGKSLKNVTVSGCTFNGVPSGLGTHHVYSSLVGNNIKFYNNKFINCYFHCCNTSGFKNFAFYNNKAVNTPTLIHAENTVGKVYNNTLNNKSLSVSKALYSKIYKFGTGGFPIESLSGVDIRNAKTSKGINKTNCSNVEIYKNSIIVGNYYPAVKANKTNGIWSLYGAKINAHDNYITGAKYRGIYVDTGKALLKNNGIKNCNIGIYLNETNGSYILNNKIRSLSDRGIQTLSCAGTNIAGNHIQSVGARAISVEAATGNNNVTGNTVFNCDGDGIYIAGSKLNRINSNILATKSEYASITLNCRTADSKIKKTLYTTVSEINSNHFFANKSDFCIYLTGKSRAVSVLHNRSSLKEVILNYGTINSAKDNTVSKHAHSFANPQTIRHTSCFNASYNKYTCSGCGFVFKANYAYPVTHRYAKKVVAPTFKSAGYTLYTCKDCKYSYKSNIKAKLTLHAVSFSVSSPSKGTAKLSWKKVAHASGYVIYYKATAKSAWSKIGTVKSNATSFTKKSLKSGKHYFTVRAVKYYGGKTYQSSYAAKAAKIK